MNPQTKTIADRAAVIAFEEGMYEQFVEMMRAMHAESETTKDLEFVEGRVATFFGSAMLNVNFVGLACVDFESKDILGVLIGGVTQPPTSDDLIAHVAVFYVKPEWRDGFVAKSLLTAFEVWAKRKGAHRAFADDVKGTLAPTKALQSGGWKIYRQGITKAIE